ncbi:hypothetical protein XYCOK13_37750 [Xylanibacillus composti]|uniref:Uncharacterized protein n=1 Tax=Xylanibacillus composti TaxID=1572762 RepID=A0A8J4H752_9BACL|nr:hypothetical protein XYCOK13_37750 [Xylanibacillus composti]
MVEIIVARNSGMDRLPLCAEASPETTRLAACEQTAGALSFMRTVDAAGERAAPMSEVWRKAGQKP